MGALGDIKFKATRGLGTFLRRNGPSGPLSWPARYAHSLLMAHNNCYYEPDANGEDLFAHWAPQALAMKTVFDVGANVGEWTEEFAAHAPGAQFHCFEPLPMNFEKLTARLGHLQEGGVGNVTLNNFGLAREDGSLDVHFNEAYQTTATTVPVHTDLVAADERGVKGDLGVAHTRTETCHFRKIDDYLTGHGISTIDLLKIDVEGMDYEVLASFPNLGPAVRAVQFEYTVYSRLNHVILKDFYELLVPKGYAVFKIFPAWLQRLDYDFRLERYADGNYVALHETVLETVKPDPHGRMDMAAVR